MLAILLISIAGILVFAALRSAPRQVPWAARLQRVNAGSPTRAEWVAPDNVLEQVEKHYLETLHWLQDAAIAPEQCREEAATYLSGNLLWRFHKQVDYASGVPSVFTGILRADHVISVRHFSDDGKRCIVVDTRSEQRMASYDAQTHHRLLTQHMGEETLVYSMVYDVESDRWKPDEFVQALPAGWQRPGVVRRIRIQSKLSPSTAGRDD